MGPNLVDEIDYDNLFDQIDDLIEFPPDDECSGDGNLPISSNDGKDFPTWNDGLPGCDPFLSGGHFNSASDLSAELSVPYEDIVQLEWLSTFVEDSFSGRGLTLPKDAFSTKYEPSANQFHTSSPISVSESTTSSTTSSYSSDKTKPPLSPNHRGPQRARTKRPRPATFNPRPAVRLISPSSSSVGTPQRPFAAGRGFSSGSDSFADSPPTRKSTGGEDTTKNKKIRLTLPANPLASPNTGQAVRKCLHCEITKTPQWRAGPMGPKTLCNACGVRYKSGRLFPEYRPAASPTFAPSLHSNSHKKVVEMRSKVGPRGSAAAEQDADEVIANA